MARPGDGSWNGNVMSAFSAKRRILSLWLPRLPIDRIKRSRAQASSHISDGCDSDDTPGVVVAKENNALLIYSLDDAAARYGLTVGQPLANARAICPHLQVFDADLA